MLKSETERKVYELEVGKMKNKEESQKHMMQINEQATGLLEDKLNEVKQANEISIQNLKRKE